MDSAPPEGSRRRSFALFLAKLGLGLALLGWLLRSGRFEPSRLLALAAPAELTGVVLGVVVMMLLPLFRWHLLLRAQGLSLGLAESARILAAGYFANAFLPAGLGLEGARLALLGRRFPDRIPEAFSTQVVDRLLGLVSLLCVGSLFGALVLARSSAELIGPVLGGSALVILAALGGLILVATRPADSPLARLPGWSALAASLRAALRYGGRPKILLSGFGLSILGHLGMVGSAFSALRCLGESPAPVEVLAIAPVVNLAAALPLAPLGLGVADSVAETLYPRVGIWAGAEAVMLARLVNLSLSLACGLALLTPARGGPEKAGSR